MKPLGLGIIGLHHQHPRWYHPLWDHLPEYRPVAIAEEDEAFLAAENEFFRLDAFTDYRKLLGRADIDVVIIFLKHSLMPEAVRAAAAAGKHIIVEKPCAADMDGMRRIAETALTHPDLTIRAPYVWRTHPVSKKIHELIVSGTVGRITAMEARLNAGTAHRYIRDNSQWMLQSSEGGGPMWNLGVHWIDYFRWITGKEITGVSGIVSGPFGKPDRDIEDNAQALLSFGDGAVGIIEASYSLPDSYPGKRDISVTFRGTQGVISWQPAWEGTTDQLLVVSDHELFGEQRCQLIEIVSKKIPGYGGHMAWTWLKDFAAAVREHRAPLVCIDDMVAAVGVADAFYRSVKSGKRETVATV